MGVITVTLSALPAEVEYLAFTVNSFRGQTFDEVENAFCRVLSNGQQELVRYQLNEQGPHTGVLIASMRRNGGDWQFKAHGKACSGKRVDQMIGNQGRGAGVMELIAGGNTPVPATRLQIRVSTGGSADVSAFRLYADGKVQGDSDMVFYGQTRSDDGTITFTSDTAGALFDIDLPVLAASVQKIAFTVTCENPGQTVSALAPLKIQVEQNQDVLVQATVDADGRSEAALIMGELYRRNQDWKFRFVSQGFNGGLKPLAEHFGVDVADEEAAPPAPAPGSASTPDAAAATPPASPVNLSKVSLTKEKPKVSLAKREDFGEIRINLNWNKKPEKKGFLGGLMSGNIDLDLGAFIETQDGQKGVN